MLINTVEGRECRIAITSGGSLEELYIERVSSTSHVGNIYKGRVTNVEPSIQAAFVDFGLSKNGFLHISDVSPQYFPKGQKGAESVGRKRARHDRPSIQACLRRGQEVVVQMTKEGIGTKGPTLTTYLSIPGRLLVMMPGMSRLGISRKVEDEDIRAKARSALTDMNLPSDMGIIVRTAGVDRPKRELQRDLNYLMRLWDVVRQRTKSSKAPAEIYQESDLVIRTIRDVYNSDISRIVCDNEQIARKVTDFLRVIVPRRKRVVELYTGTDGIFHDVGLEKEIEKISSRRVMLKSGGSLVIDQTEAMVAIDVNSGRYRDQSDAEATALKINIEAAGEIVRQLRLRDLGGVIVIDFIDMRNEANRRAVELALRKAIKQDRAKTKVLRISSLGLVEMTRQRLGPSLRDSTYQTCTYCQGAGLIKSDESLGLMVMRNLQRATANEEVTQVNVAVSPAVANHLANHHRQQICQIESRTDKTVIINADADLAGDEIRITCTNGRGSTVQWQWQAPAASGKLKLATTSIEDLPAPEEPAGEPPKADTEEKKPKKRPRRRRGGRKHKRNENKNEDEAKGDAKTAHKKS